MRIKGLSHSLSLSLSRVLFFHAERLLDDLYLANDHHLSSACFQKEKRSNTRARKVENSREVLTHTHILSPRASSNSVCPRKILKSEDAASRRIVARAARLRRSLRPNLDSPLSDVKAEKDAVLFKGRNERWQSKAQVSAKGSRTAKRIEPQRNEHPFDFSKHKTVQRLP